MREKPGPTPEEMDEETKTGMGRREFLKGLAGLGAAAGLAREAKAEPQQAKEKEKSQSEKLKEISQIVAAAKKFDEIEEQNYKKYIKSPKDSDEEWSLHLELNANHRLLRTEIYKLADLAGDNDNKVADEATKAFLESNVGIERRQKECRDAGKRELALPPPPKNPRPK